MEDRLVRKLMTDSIGPDQADTGRDETLDEVVEKNLKDSSSSRKIDASLELWQRWVIDSDANARRELIEFYLEYARIIAATTYARRTHNDIEFEEYMQLASVGLLESIDRFNPSFNVLFRTFAARRIHGAILNGLIRLTEKNQQIAVKMRLRKERLDSLKETGDQNDKHSNKVRSPDELFSYLAEVGVGLALGVLLDGSGMVDGDAFGSTAQAASPEVTYFQRSEIDALRQTIKNTVALLNSQQQLVIRSHYLQDNSFEEIASNMNLSRGRISQIHKQALLCLRRLMAERNGLGFEL